jgi:hypothetical protein
MRPCLVCQKFVTQWTAGSALVTVALVLVTLDSVPLSFASFGCVKYVRFQFVLSVLVKTSASVPSTLLNRMLATSGPPRITSRVAHFAVDRRTLGHASPSSPGPPGPPSVRVRGTNVVVLVRSFARIVPSGWISSTNFGIHLCNNWSK